MLKTKLFYLFCIGLLLTVGVLAKDAAKEITQQTLAVTSTISSETAKSTGMPFWLSETLISFGIIIASWLVYWIFQKFGIKLLVNLTRKTKSGMDDNLVLRLGTPLSLILFTLGLYITLTRLKILHHYQLYIDSVYLATLLIIAAFILTRTIRVLLEWYAHNVATRTRSTVDTEFIPIVRKVINVVIWIACILLALDYLGFGDKVKPLLAGLGIGGLAVALALQDTLSNFFSGFYVMVDKPFRVGDFVRLESGNEGFIEHIGWRSTRIRATGNNTIVIPNGKLAQSLVTNFYLPSRETQLAVECSVSYDNDLELVEKIALDVAKEIHSQIERTKKDFEPIIRFHTFGDSNVQFRVILSVEDFRHQYQVKHEFMKALFKRFKKENISITPPARSVIIEKTTTAPLRKTKSDSPPHPELFDSGESKENPG